MDVGNPRSNAHAQHADRRAITDQTHTRTSALAVSSCNISTITAHQRRSNDAVSFRLNMVRHEASKLLPHQLKPQSVPPQNPAFVSIYVKPGSLMSTPNSSTPHPLASFHPRIFPAESYNEAIESALSTPTDTFIFAISCREPATNHPHPQGLFPGNPRGYPLEQQRI